MEFVEELVKLNINPNQEMLNRFDLYYKKLVEVNSYMNLTAITEESEVYNKHFLDSLMIIKSELFTEEVTLLDVGSGAGFPSIPLAIVNNDVKVTIIDALNKRINFLNDLTKHLGLDNVVAYHKRAEDFAKERRESFDIVTARAVARLNVLAELCLPLTKIGGHFIAMKGKMSKEEMDEAMNAISVLGGKVSKVVSVNLPDEAGERDLIVIKKVKSTPNKYPRQFNKIKERPL